MIRIFLPPEQLSTEQVIITGEKARYLSSVLRVSPGEPLIILDGLGFKYSCRIIHCHRKEVIAEKIKKEPCSAESPVSITLAQGIAKGDKMDFIVQKTTELGISTIIPLITERSQIRHTHKTERWKKIALSASQQSGRHKIPDIEEPVSLEEFFSRYITPLAKGYIENIKGVNLESTGKIIFSEEYMKRNLKEIINGFRGVRDISLLIGPEGGFSKKEVDKAVENGFIEASLGPRILRTETAPVAALSIIQYELGDLA